MRYLLALVQCLGLWQRMKVIKKSSQIIPTIMTLLNDGMYLLQKLNKTGKTFNQTAK